MRLMAIVFLGITMIAAHGCAATGTVDDSVRFQVSDKARQLLEEQGKTLAAMRGHSRETDLVCERFYKTGSHITVNYCYTRAEMEQRRLNHQEEYRRTSTPGAKCLEGGVGNLGRTSSRAGTSCLSPISQR